MNINDFLAVAKEFFDQLNPNFCEYYIEDNNDKLDEEKGFQEVSDDEECEEEMFWCELIRQISLFINPGIYKKLNANKVD